MSIFSSADKELQAAALKAGFRTASQTFETGLGLITAGGAILGATELVAIDWRALAGALGFIGLNAIAAGSKSYLNIVNNGLPTQYQNAAVSQIAKTSGTADAAAEKLDDAA